MCGTLQQQHVDGPAGLNVLLSFARFERIDYRAARTRWRRATGASGRLACRAEHDVDAAPKLLVHEEESGAGAAIFALYLGTGD